VLLEEVATDRTYETGYERVTARLEPLQTSVLYLVSDRAKALIKLAKTGLACPSIPDLFHLLHELVKGYSLGSWRQLKTARQRLSRAQEHLATCQAEGVSQAQVESAQVAVTTGEAEVAHWQQVRHTYRRHLEAMSLSVHPWRVKDSMPQSSQEVEAQLAAEVVALQELLETNGLPVKQKVLDKVRKQLADLAAVLDVWWQTVRHIVLAGKQGRCAQPDHLDAEVGDLGGGALVAADVLAGSGNARAGSPAQSPVRPGARDGASRL
jgi:hypothetical protein